MLDVAAINDIKRDLHASDAEIALSLSTFIIVLGGSPLFWSAVSEIKGRKVCFQFFLTFRLDSSDIHIFRHG